MNLIDDIIHERLTETVADQEIPLTFKLLFYSVTMPDKSSTYLLTPNYF
jgi:hypothetical protein